MSAANNLVGMRFGRLEVVERQGSNKYGKALFLCKCDCGNTIITLGKLLKSGETKSCGCINSEQLKTHNAKHGFSKRGSVERLYKVWLSMKSRIFNPNENVYKHYGGRGIGMCDAWKNSYPAFREWAYANGYDEAAPRGRCTIDRIDVNGDYCPENCRWVDQSTQAQNKRRKEQSE